MVTAPDMPRAASTTIPGSTPGRRWRTSTQACVAPSARAAVTCSRSRSDSTSPRTVRAKVVQPTSPITSGMVRSDGGSTVASTISRSRLGMVRTRSTTHMHAASIQPPR